MKVKNKKRLIMIPIEESLEPLTDAFIYAVYAGNLWIHTCQHCGKLFLSDTDANYCQAKACQHQILLKKWKADRQNIMNDETKHMRKTLGDYLRKQKSRVKKAGASEQMLKELEAQITSLEKESAMIASKYLDMQIPPDEEYIAFCEKTKAQFKAECDKLKKELKERNKPTQPT